MERVPAISDPWLTPGGFASSFFGVSFGKEQDGFLPTGKAIFNRKIYHERFFSPQ
jgi:hypothetical protein